MQEGAVGLGEENGRGRGEEVSKTCHHLVRTPLPQAYAVPTQRVKARVTWELARRKFLGNTLGGKCGN